MEVRPAAEILATLDEGGCLDGVPFMPEMLEHLNRRLTVAARLERACDTINKGGRVRRMPDTVFLDDLRCDGSGHGGCGADCRLYWKEAWLRRVEPGEPVCERGRDDYDTALEELARRSSTVAGQTEPTYRCQATEFVRATEELGWWDPKSFVREVTCGNVSIWRFVAVCTRIFADEVRRRTGFWSYPVKPAGCQGAPGANLNLQPGRMVQIRTKREIEQTLDESGKNRGLWFDREMLPYCGSTQTVKRRVERLIDERTGRMIELKRESVILEGVICRSYLSEGRWFCPRAISSWWRDDWLRAPVENEASIQPSSDRARSAAAGSADEDSASCD